MTATIRLATVDDAEQMLAIYAPIVVSTIISFELEPPTVVDMRQRIAKIVERWPWLACADGGTLLGYAYASAHRERAAYQWSVDVSVYVHERGRRRGVGRGLYTSLFRVLVLQGYVNAYAGVTLPNPASVGLHKSLGFRPVGIYQQVGYKLGAWHDVGWWQLALQPRSENPAPPVPLPALPRQAAWQDALAAGLPLVGL